MDSIFITDTYTYTGEVSYDEKGKILIHYLENKTIEPEIDKNGKLTLGTKFSGEFDNENKVTFYYS